jgi:hypothetical protein
MRRIGTTGINLAISHAAIARQGLTEISMSLKVDAIKYLNGETLIDSIVAQQVPDIAAYLPAIQQADIEAQQQQFITAFLDNGSAAWTTYLNTVDGTILSTTLDHRLQSFIHYMAFTDNAIDGYISIGAGDRSITYTDV